MSNIEVQTLPRSSKEKKSKKLTKHKSFMSRISSAFSSSHDKHAAKPSKSELASHDKCAAKPSKSEPVSHDRRVAKPSKSEPVISLKSPKREKVHHEKEEQTPVFPENTVIDKSFETAGSSRNIDSGYATIGDIVQTYESSDEVPPVPSKNFDSLYAKVKKKEYTDIGINTDEVSDIANTIDNSPNGNANVFDELLVNTCKTIDMTVPKIVDASETQHVTEQSKSKGSSRPKSGKSTTAGTIKKIMLRHQGELKQLKDDLQKVLAENKSLQEQVTWLLEQEKKWKEDISLAIASQQEHLNTVVKNYELNDRITRLELETKQEVQVLCEKIALIKNEKDRLHEELDALSKENELLKHKCDKMAEERKTLISVQTHTKEIKNHKKLEQELKEQCENEIKKWQDKYNALQEEKNSSSINARLLEDANKSLEKENLNLKSRQQELTVNSTQLSERLNELVESERKAYELQITLQNMVKSLVAERDSLIKELQFIEGHRNEILTLFRQFLCEAALCKEHIKSTGLQIRSENQVATDRLKEAEMLFIEMSASYEKQLDILRQKIIEKNSLVDDLQREKRKAELDFETLWHSRALPQHVSSKELQT